MRRFLLSLALLVACAAPALGQTAPERVIVRSSLQPESGAVVGQHIRVFVDVLFLGQMPRPPRVVLPDVAGAQVLRLESQATTMSDTVDGQAYAGQRFEFALYPRRGGAIVVPSAAITLLDAAGDAAGAATGQELRVEVTVPPGVDPSGPVIATGRATLEEQWKPALTTVFKAGDALVRTITREADDIPAMAMRDLAFTAPPGVRVYIDPPQSEDRQNRGELVGKRIDRVTYVFERGGSFGIPGVAQPWWDLGAGRLQVARRPAVTVTVSAPPLVSVRDWSRPTAWLGPGLAAAAMLALIGLAGWGWPRLRAILADREARWLASEPKAFRDLLAVCQTGDVAAIYRAFVIWRQRSPSPSLLGSLAEELEQILFGDPSQAAWSPVKRRSFIGKLQAARRHLKQRETERAADARLVLPPLNPPGVRCE